MAASGGTNYKSALASAYSWINSTGADAPLANSTFNKVMFVSDGEPTAWDNGSGGQVNFSNITTAVNEMLGRDGSNEPQQIITAVTAGGNWSIDAIGISLGTTAVTADADAATSYDANSGTGTGNFQLARILTNDATGVQLAQVSAWSNNVIAIGNLVNTMKSGTRSYGVEGGGSNGINIGEVLRIRFRPPFGL